MTPRSSSDAAPHGSAGHDTAGMDTAEQVVEQIRRMLANPRRTRR